jgi:hypothetical protein
MPLLRSKLAVHRARARFVGRFFASIAIVTLVFALIAAGHYLTGWW